MLRFLSNSWTGSWSMSECCTAWCVTWVPTTSKPWNSSVHPGEPYIQFQNQAIAAVYDPPHLLKCTCNLFLKYDVQSILSFSTASFLLLLSGNTLRSYTNLKNGTWSVRCIRWLTPTWTQLLSVPWKCAWPLKSRGTQ